MDSPFAGPSSARKLTGSVPGVLDPSQRDRLLSFSKSTLSFAFFNPRTATSSQLTPDARKLSLNDDMTNPRRIVIEALPNGSNFWRFVPKAQLDESVTDEGDWPRIIEICGTLCECSQDQWDIYKLDPLYECRVRAPPALTIITEAAPKSPESPHSTGKRNTTKAGIPPLNPRKRKTIKTGISFDVDLDENEVQEVEDMIIDMPSPRAKSAGPGSRSKKMREGILRERQTRREYISRRTEKLSNREEEVFYNFTATERSQSVPFENAAKRKATLLADPLRSPEREAGDDFFRDTFIYEQNTQGKRTRKTSPGAARRELDAKRAQRQKRRQIRQRAKVDGHRQQWHEQFMQEVYAEVPDLKSPPNDIPAQNNENEQSDDSDDDSESENFTGGPSTDTSVDEDVARAAAIAESRRKLAELESDRPLWEENAKKRALREKAEEEAERLKAEQRKWAEIRRVEEARQAESRRKAQEAREQQEASHREREEADRREREEAARRRRERDQRWAYGPWTSLRALERYKVLSEAFDTTKFSANDPISFDLVPWPVLTAPSKLSVEDVDWNAVEKFFYTVRPHLRTQDYKAFVEKSHRRFHPDRWRSRGLLKTVVDEAERDCLEVAATTVAQALTPLWRELTGR